MFSFPSCIAVDNSGRLFHDLLRNLETRQATSVSRIMGETSWDVEQTRKRLPFLVKTTKQRFKHNICINMLNTSCRVNDKVGDLNPVSYRTEKKIYSFLTICKQWHVSCKQPTHGFFSCCHIIYLVRPGGNFRWHQDDSPLDQKIVLKLFVCARCTQIGGVTREEAVNPLWIHLR